MSANCAPSPGGAIVYLDARYLTRPGEAALWGLAGW